MQIRSASSCVLLVAVAMLSACGDKPEEAPAAGAVPGVSKPVLLPGAADQVAAVTLSGNDAPVLLRFALKSKPSLNQAMEMEFTLQPTRDIDSAQLAFESNDDIGVASDNPFFSLARTAAGKGESYKLTLVPRRQGILALTAIATVDLPTGPVARTFSIPIIVTADVPATPGRVPAKPADPPARE